MAHAAGGFRQVHDGQNAKLQAWVASHVTPGNRLLDLFGGHGNLSLPIADRQSEIHCVDYGAPGAHPEGTPKNYFFHRAPVGPWLVNKAKEKSTLPTSAVLDPPRDGLGENWLPIVQSLQAMQVTELLVIGCEPDAWARDLHRYTRHGWELKEIAALDLFPQTHHVEALAVLRV
jgi:23S rRNA (uracil1939-C5)-methyltransferase